MFFIAHRGNINGPKPERENTVSYIMEALMKGYHVEIDVWLVHGKLYLGHDKPEHPTDLKFLKVSSSLICHAKNPEALEYLLMHNIHCFSHNIDDVVLTSKGWMWTYPGKTLTNKSVAVMPEMAGQKPDNLRGCLAVCSDYVAFLPK